MQKYPAGALTDRHLWKQPPTVQRTQSVANPADIRDTSPPPPPSRYRTADGVLDTPRSVCLLRLRRRTFLFLSFLPLKDYFLPPSTSSKPLIQMLQVICLKMKHFLWISLFELFSWGPGFFLWITFLYLSCYNTSTTLKHSFGVIM